jgi:hypothetical protein
MYMVILMLVVVDMQCKGRLAVISIYVSMMFAWSSFELPFKIRHSHVLMLCMSSVYNCAPWRWIQIIVKTHSSGSVHRRVKFVGNNLIYVNKMDGRCTILDSLDPHTGKVPIYLLTPWNIVLLDKLTGLQLVKKIPTFYGTRRFINTLASAQHLSLSWASPIQSIHPHPTSWRSILILSSHPHLGIYFIYYIANPITTKLWGKITN